MRDHKYCMTVQSTWEGGACADLVIEIPGSGGGEAEPLDGGHYRLDYRPPQGSPAPNFTVPARASTINFVGLPGTKYHFMLYYSNATFADLLTWNQTIITGSACLVVTSQRNDFRNGRLLLIVSITIQPLVKLLIKYEFRYPICIEICIWFVTSILNFLFDMQLYFCLK